MSKKEVLTKQQRYEIKMKKNHFIRIHPWVHVNDIDKVKIYCHNLLAKRLKEISD